MNKPNKPGDRVGAILEANEDEVYLLGYGVYDGDFKPTIPILGIPVEDIPNGLTNPRITLDNGNVVWGCQCWWGDEGKVKESIGARKVIDAIKILEAL